MSNTVKQTPSRAAPARAAQAARIRQLNNKRSNSTTTAISRSMNSIGQEIVHEACAISNPFCDASRGSKWPDQTAGFTLAVPVRFRIPVTTDAAGNFAIMLTPSYPFGILVCEISPGGRVNWMDSEGDNRRVVAPYQPIFESADSYRIVSMGFKVTPVTSAMNSQGYVNIIELPPAETQEDYVDLWTNTKSYPSYETLPLKSHESIYAVCRPSGSTAREFRPTQFKYALEAGDPFSTGDWSSILVNVGGAAPLTSVAIIDVYMNLEVTVKSDANYAFLLTQAPTPNPQLTALATTLTQHGSVFLGDDESVDVSFAARAYRALGNVGSFAKDNAGNILRIGAAIAQARSGNVGAAGGHLLSLANSPSRTRAMIVD